MNRRSSKRTTVQVLRSQYREDVSRAILSAAEVVLGEQGTDARMEAIAAEAGLAVGTLYNHFADRQALLEALVASHRIVMTEEMKRSVKETEGCSLRERLSALLEAMFTAALPKARFRLLLMEGTTAYFTRRKQMRERFGEILAPIFKEARKRGELATDTKGIQTALLFGLIQSIFALIQEGNSKLTAKEAANIITTAFLDGTALRRAD